MIRILRASTGDWKKFRYCCGGRRNVYFEICNGEHAAADECSEARKQAERNHESTNELNPAAGLCKRIVRTGHAAEHPDDQLSAMTSKH